MKIDELVELRVHKPKMQTTNFDFGKTTDYYQIKLHERKSKLLSYLTCFSRGSVHNFIKEVVKVNLVLVLLGKSKEK